MFSIERIHTISGVDMTLSDSTAKDDWQDELSTYADSHHNKRGRVSSI